MRLPSLPPGRPAQKVRILAPQARRTGRAARSTAAARAARAAMEGRGNQLTEEAPMRVIIIGGSGHVGTYLVPRLVAAGHDVVAVSRGQRAPYQPHAAWRSVAQVELDRES